jgi:hypothetical protein
LHRRNGVAAEVDACGGIVDGIDRQGALGLRIQRGDGGDDDPAPQY